MTIVRRDEAVKKITAEIGLFACDDLVDVHNELFPDSLQSMVDGEVNSEKLAIGITNYIQAGLEVEEIVDLWNVVFPKDRNVWYDDETETLHINEEPAHVESSD